MTPQEDDLERWPSIDEQRERDEWIEERATEILCSATLLHELNQRSDMTAEPAYYACLACLCQFAARPEHLQVVVRQLLAFLRPHARAMAEDEWEAQNAH
jgi:hypothetical protein